MTSSLRNSIHRRNHKERSQLAHRAKLGILEKHADYVKRARDYHSKQDRLTRLKQKAAEKNQDEFYFSMRNQKTKNGVHIQSRGNIALPTDIVKVLRTQDENYVRTVRVAGLKKIDKLKNQLTTLADLVKPGVRGGGMDDGDVDLDEEEREILINAGIISADSKSLKKGKGRQNRQNPGHVVFVDSEEDARNYKRTRVLTSRDDGPSTLAETPVPDLGWKVMDDRNKSRMPSKTSDPSENGTPIESSVEDPATNGVSDRRRLLKELSARLARDTQLRYAEREFEMQRLMMSKGGRKKLKGAEKMDGEDSDEEDEDEIDARRGKRIISVRKVDEKTYKPRVYKWRLERKR